MVEFLLVPQAATGTFLVLGAIALVDLICGFAVSIRTASRDITLDTAALLAGEVSRTAHCSRFPNGS